VHRSPGGKGGGRRRLRSPRRGMRGSGACHGLIWAAAPRLPCMSVGISRWLHRAPVGEDARMLAKTKPTPVMANDGRVLCAVTWSKASSIISDILA
jgi:hypothetical protein